MILIAATQGKLPRRKRPDTFALPSDLVEGVVETSDTHKEEQRCLFYVGLTCAKDSLTVTWSRRYAQRLPGCEERLYGLPAGRNTLGLPQQWMSPSWSAQLIESPTLICEYVSSGGMSGPRLPQHTAEPPAFRPQANP